MIRKSLRAVAVLATFAFIFPIAGCLRFREELVINPDGSGKITLTIGMSQAFIDKMKGMGPGGAEVDEKMGMDPEDLENAEGVVAFTKPVHEKKDGWETTTITAYFEDINKVKFWEKEGEKKKLKLAFTFKKEGEGHVLEVEDKFTDDGDSDKMDEMPAETKDQIWEQAKPMLKGFEISKGVKMPGPVTAVEGFTKKEGRLAQNKVTEESIKTLEDLTKSMKAAKAKVVSGKSEMTDADLAAFKKELDEAKAAWPKIREELLAEAAKKKKDKEKEKND